jgi:NAD(P)H-hydrate epimerase
MKVVLNEEMKKIDKITIEQYGIPGIVLMENAGLGVVDEIIQDFDRTSKVTIVCGRGNNGGDGFVIARHLFNKGYDIKIFVAGGSENISGDALINYKIIKNLNIDVEEIVKDEEISKLKESISHSSVVVDALFGTGLNSDVHGRAEKIINIINDYSKYVIAVDIPSGVNGNNGQICNVAVKADKTISFGFPKLGNVVFPGAEYNGKLVLKDIGIPNKVIESINLRRSIIDKEVVGVSLPKRNRDSHKGNFGKADIIAGSIGMEGAAILTSKAALRSGLGLLRLYIAESLNAIIKTSVPEAITVPQQEMRKGIIGIHNIATILEGTKGTDVVAVGPGCKKTPELSEIIQSLLKELEIPIVIDADGLNVLAKNIEWLSQKKSKIVITPHLGEMSRLTGISIDEIKKNKVKVAEEFAKKWDVITVLKGASTIVASPDGKVFINTTGNPGMATAGSGDVLTGIVTGLIAQGIEPLMSAIIGVYIHGLAGDKAAEEKGEYGLIAGDIIEKLPEAIKEIL